MLCREDYVQKGYMSMYQECKRISHFIKALEKETEEYSFNAYQIMDLLKIVYLMRISDALDRISLDL